ncbi:MAG TPA: endonuclease III [Chloroflexota bacterium]|nr:endonuclease III [Chloroflexota bacterium]
MSDTPGAPGKRPFDIDLALAHIEEAIRPYPKAMLFELAEAGFSAPFEQLVACMVSIRTRDETSLRIMQRLFRRARTPQEILDLASEDLDELIRESSFHEAKTRQIQAIARRALEEFGGQVPCDFEVLTSFPGVGPKCANLVLGIACQQPKIGVDIHVHRVTNRWGYVRASTPEQTLAALERTLPHRYWVDINRLLVPFGKHICTGVRPRCSTCPVLEMCQQVGVVAPA